MSTLGYAELLRLLDEVNRVGQTQTLRIVLESMAEAAPGVATETAAAGVMANRAGTATFDAIRTQSLLYEETQRLHKLLLARLGEIHRPVRAKADAAGSPPAPVLREPLAWTEPEILDLLNAAQLALLEHPTAAQAAFAALVREGRQYAETDEGKEWLEVLGRSGLMQRARWVW